MRELSINQNYFKLKQAAGRIKSRNGLFLSVKTVTQFYVPFFL